MVLKKFTNFLLELFFPKFCFNCRAEGDYLCQDCRAVLEVSRRHLSYISQNLKDLYFALNYQSPLIKNLIQKFKYEPFIKELAKPLSSLIIEHLQLLDNPPPFFGGEVAGGKPPSPRLWPRREKSEALRTPPFAIAQEVAEAKPHLPPRSAREKNFVLVPVPLEKRKLKRRGFNQAEEIGKKLSSFLAIPLIPNCLIKTKETVPQVKLTAETRKANIKGVFLVKNETLVKNKKILLVDDVWTTGSTMEEAARVLKMAGAKEIIGIVVARAKPGDDQF